MKNNKRKYLEALLFASEGIVERPKLTRALSVSERELDDLVSELKSFYDIHESALKISSSQTHVSLSVRDEHLPFIKNFIEAEFSTAVLKTLAMIAYKSPAKQSDIIKARGNKSYDHIKELMNASLVEAEDHGNTKILRLTPKFFKYFNISKKDFEQKFKDSNPAE